MLRWGPEDGPVVVMALPLFEEANRVRAFAVSICRALAERGVAGALPDLPGTGESVLPTHSVTLDNLEAAHRDCVEQLAAGNRRVYAGSIRSGWLADVFSGCWGHWRFAPQNGPALLRELTRVKQATQAERLGDLWYGTGPIQMDGLCALEVAGNLVSPALLTGLLAADLPSRHEDDLPLRTVRLSDDPGEADRKLPGTPLWRRAEPGNDLVMAQVLADDIAQWVRACEGC